jgi:hypothetical protein
VEREIAKREKPETNERERTARPLSALQIVCMTMALLEDGGGEVDLILNGNGEAVDVRACPRANVLDTNADGSIEPDAYIPPHLC